MSFWVSKQRYESGLSVSWGWEAPSLSPFLPALKKCYFGPEKPAWCFQVEGVPPEVALVLSVPRLPLQ